MRTLRTPDDRFAAVTGFDHEPRYAEVPDGEGGTLRMAYVEAGPADARWCCSCTASPRGPSSTATSSRR